MTNETTLPMPTRVQLKHFAWALGSGPIAALRSAPSVCRGCGTSEELSEGMHLGGYCMKCWSLRLLTLAETIPK